MRLVRRVRGWPRVTRPGTASWCCVGSTGVCSFARKDVYTYCGIVLVAINPFDKALETALYSHDVLRQHRADHLGEADPHVFAVARRALQGLTDGNGANQSIVVSGESGAGKTVSAKYVMRYFKEIMESEADNERTSSGKGHVNIEKKIVACNPVLEAFGNAKTTRNDNSSRFGKYTEICFAQPDGIASWHIVGAKISTFLLEKLRVVVQGQGERAYHVFYYLLQACVDANGVAGEQQEAASDDYVSAAFLRELKLGDPAEFYYTNQSGDAGPALDTSLDEFDNVQALLDFTGLGLEEQKHLWTVLAAILHLGNVGVSDAEESSVASDDRHLAMAASMLGIGKQPLRESLTHKKILEFQSPVSREAAVAARDALAKHIFSHTFDFIVRTMNRTLEAQQACSRNAFIGVLDIYGFEIFETNSFEQFCINYANEKLQLQFNQHVFALEQEEYVREEISWSFIDFYDNQPCLDMIEGKLGILALLDEESHLSHGSDRRWSAKLNDALKDRDHFVEPNKSLGANTAFVVSHYAANVCYDCQGFIQKNKDAISEAHRALLASSGNRFIQSLFATEQKSARLKRRSIKRRDRLAPTVSSDFSKSLNHLMDKISLTQPHYIR